MIHIVFGIDEQCNKLYIIYIAVKWWNRNISKFKNFHNQIICKINKQNTQYSMQNVDNEKFSLSF